MDPAVLTAIGAFLSGVGSVLSAVWYVRRQRKEWDAECRERIQAFRDGLHEMHDPGRDEA